MINNLGQQIVPATSPNSSHRVPLANSPGPIDIYNSPDITGYLQATSPQPSGFGHNLAAVSVSNPF